MIRRLPSTAATVLIVGHDPAIQDLAVSLARDRQPQVTSLTRMRTKFPTAAMATLEISGAWSVLARGGAHLVSFVTPRDVDN